MDKKIEEEIQFVVLREINTGDPYKFLWRTVQSISSATDIDLFKTHLALRELGRRGLVVHVPPDLWMSRERYNKTTGFFRRLRGALIDRIVY